MNNGYVRKEDYPNWDRGEYNGIFDEEFEDDPDPTGLQDEFDACAGTDCDQ